MSSSITQRNGSKSHTVRYRDVAGKSRDRTFKTKKLAQDFQAELEYKTRESVFIDPKQGDTKFSEYAERWLSNHTGSAGTIKSYRLALSKHIIPVIGNTPLRKITRESIQDLLSGLSLGISRKTVCLAVITSILDEAVKSKKIAENTGAGIKLAAISTRAKFHAANLDEVSKLADAMPEERRLAVWLMYGCGLRIGEALGVSEGCVRGKTLRIHEQALNSTEFGPLKGRKEGDFRDIPLPGIIAKKIAEHVKAYGTDSEGHIFRQTSDASFRMSFCGRPEDKGRRAVKEGAIKIAGLPEDFTPHSLRHVYASNMLAAGIPITDLSRFLGHKNIQTTHGYYGHLVPDTLDKAVAAMDAILGQ